MLPTALRTQWFSLGVLILTTAAPTAHAQTWERLGPQGTNVRCLASESDAGVIYAATQGGGVFASHDGGVTWSPARSGLPVDLAQTGAYLPVRVVRVAASAGRVYALAASGIYSSDQGGNAWTVRPSPTTGFLVDLLVEDVTPPALVLVSREHGVYVSADGGALWSPHSEGLGADAMDLVAARSRFEDGVIYLVAGNMQRLYRSAAGGAWELKGPLPGGAFLDLEIEPGPTGHLFLSMTSGCFASEDAGLSWSPMIASNPARPIHRFVGTGAGVLAIGRGGLYAVKTGAPMRLDAVGDFPYTRATDGLVRGDGSLVIASDMGVFRGGPEVLTGGAPLTLSAEGLGPTDVVQVAPAAGSDVVYALTGISYDGGVFRSPDGGDTWEQRSLGLTNPDVRSIAVFAGNPDVVYVGTADALDDTGENGKVFKTTDGGLTWMDVTPVNDLYSGARIVIALAVHPTNPDVVYASVQSYFGGIFKSEDGGQTWERRALGLESMPEMPGYDENPFHNYLAMLSLAIDRENPETLYIGAGGCWGGTYVSHDGALTWSRRDEHQMELDAEIKHMPDMFSMHLELFDIDVSSLDPSHLLATGGRGAMAGNGQVGVLFESKDGGESWTLVREKSKSDYFSSPNTGIAFHSLHAGEWVLANRGGVTRTLNGGQTWTPLNEGLSAEARFTRNIAMDPDDSDRLYLATATAGVWRRQLAPTPVRLTHLEAAQAAGGAVQLRWGVAEASDHAGFLVDREVGHDRARLTSALLVGRNEYTFEDPTPVVGAVNRYWVIEVDRAGRETPHGPVEVTPAGAGRLALGPAYPNPMRGATTLSLTTTAATPVSVRVLDARGREVATILDGLLPAGVHAMSWDGRDARGRLAAAGVYFVSARAGSERALTKILVLPGS